MDRNSWNSIIGFTLIFVIIFVWAKLNSPTAEELAAKAKPRDSLALVEQSRGSSKVASPSSVPDSTINDVLLGGVSDSGAMASAVKEEIHVLENDKVRISFSSRGGRIISAQLKEYKKITHEKGSKNDLEGPLFLMQDQQNRFDYLLSWDGSDVRTGDLLFEPSSNGNALTYTLRASNGAVFTQEYVLGDKYSLDYRITQTGVDMARNPLVLEWQNHMERIEKNHEYERIFSTVYFKPASEDPDYCSCRSSDQQELKEPVKWVSHAHQFFNSTLIADASFASGEMRTEMSDDPAAPNLKLAYSKLVFPQLPSGKPFAMKFYVGPNDYNELQAFGERVEDIIPFGWSLFGSINRHVVRPVFNFLSGFDLNKGIVILLLTLLVKMLLYPLTYKMLKSQATMGALKPKLAHLKEKFKDDAQQQQIETMKVYREFGVNPLGGCMPMVLQMPIWIALYRFFPASIEFRQEGFLWADDLSSYDAFIQLSFEIPFYGDHISLFTLIWVITTIIYTYYSTKDMDMSVNPAMKYLQYFMPIMFLFWFNNYASGLTAYMCISNILNIGQTIVTRNYIIDHEKIKAQLELNKLKPKKKSSFQERLESALREQQQRQQSQGKGKK